MRLGIRTVAAGSAIVTVVWPASVAAHPDASPAKLPVTAFFQSWMSTNLITRSADATTTVGVDGISISSDGGSVPAPDASARHALAITHQDGLLGEIVVSNWSNAINDFSTPAAHRLLSSPANISAVAAELAGDVSSQGWDGVSVDLEALRAGDAGGLVSFLEALRGDLAAGKSISICISNSVTPAEYRDRGYDLTGIASNVDRVIDMAYDQHGPWERQPGPIGAFGWQRAGLAAMEQTVPAAQIDLGQAGYGYIWRPHGTYTVGDAKARAIVARNHATARFNDRVGEWVAHLSDGSTMWWADARSFAARLRFARSEQLHGLAVWDLGDSDTLRQ